MQLIGWALPASVRKELACLGSFCFEIPCCVDLVPKICVRSREFNQQCCVGGGEHVDVRRGGRHRLQLTRNFAASEGEGGQGVKMETASQGRG
jgi:hypothetical protein